MAISTPSLLATASSEDATQTSLSTASISPTGSGLVIAVGFAFDTLAALGTISISDGFSGGLGSWTTHAIYSGDGKYAAIIGWCQAGSSPGSGTVTLNFSTNARRSCFSVSEIASGFDTSTPVPQYKQSAVANLSTASITLDSSPSSGSAVVGAITVREDADGDITEGTDFTELADFGSSSGSVGAWQEVEYDLTPADGTADWSGLSTTYALKWAHVIEVAEAAVAGGATVNPFTMAAHHPLYGKML